MIFDWNEIRYGFVDKDGNVVIPARYDKVFDDFNSEKDLVRVGKRYTINYGTEKKPRKYTYFYVGVINSKGEELIQCDKYDNLCFVSPTHLCAKGSRLVETGCSLIDIQGNTIVPSGIYSEIYHFIHGFARTRKNISGGGATWGVIDEEGNTIIPCGVFENIWDMDPKYAHIVVRRDGKNYTLSIEILRKLQRELKTTGSINTSVEEYLSYHQYLQRNFSVGEMISFDESLKDA